MEAGEVWRQLRKEAITDDGSGYDIAIDDERAIEIIAAAIGMDKIWLALADIMTAAFAEGRKQKALKDSPTVMRALNTATDGHGLCPRMRQDTVYNTSYAGYTFPPGEVFVLGALSPQFGELLANGRITLQYIVETDYPEQLAKLKAALGD